MKKPAPTLADAVMRESLRPHGRIPRQLGEKVAEARKFVLDGSASEFLADLSHAAYTVSPGNQRNIALVEQTRQLSRLPHAVAWFEYDARAMRRRSMQNYKEVSYIQGVHIGNHLVASAATPAQNEEVVPQIGWLMIENGETSFTVYTFVGAPDQKFIAVLPYSIHWTTDDSVPAFASALPKLSTPDAYLATGIKGYEVPQVVYGMVPGVRPMQAEEMIAEFVGELRFVWALLSTINDIPVGIKHVRPAKGYIARGRYRSYFQHSVISLVLPKGRDPRVVARKVVELSRRRAHQVRGHWRRDWRHEGNRIWIREHQRGDASLGMVVHDYAVKHGEENRQVREILYPPARHIEEDA